MQRGIGEDIVEQVRQATDIVELIGAYVGLRPAGRGFKACCPFHKEKTPSFHVSPERQLFHCFGCGVGGDAFSFMMQHEGLTFPEALELLAHRAGIRIPEKRAVRGSDRAQIVAALKAAVRFYRGKLRGETGAAARRYLTERKIPDVLVDRYYVGFAPAGGRALLDSAAKQLPTEILLQAGLVGQSEDGRLYDRFRERIVIPILGVGGEPIGFGARALRPQVEPKYLNSPETSVYKKSRVLFGLPQARAAVRAEGHALVVEGYFDVLGLATAGVQHVVAPCGTAWTPEHVQLLLRFTKRLVFLFDGDPAGEAAAWKAMEGTLPVHADVGLVVLPPGQDPDDMVRAGESDRLRELLATPLSPVAFAVGSLERQGIDGPPRMGRIAQLLGGVGDGIAREMMIEEAAAAARIPGRVLRQEVEKRVARMPPRPRGAEALPGPKAEPLRLGRLEEAVLRLAQHEPATAGELRAAATGVPGIRAALLPVLGWIEERARAGRAPDPPELLQCLRAEVGDGVDIGFLLAGESPAPGARYREDVMRRLQDQALEVEKEALGHQIAVLEGEGGQEVKVAELLARIQELAREQTRLRQR